MAHGHIASQYLNRRVIVIKEWVVESKEGDKKSNKGEKVKEEFLNIDDISLVAFKGGEDSIINSLDQWTNPFYIKSIM